MMLPLLLTLLAPADAEPPDPPSPCEVSWGDAISPRFIDGTIQRIDRRCRELVDAMGFDDEPGSIHIEVGGETYAFTIRVDLVKDGEVVYRQEEDGEVYVCGGNDLAAFSMKRVVAAVNDFRTPAENIGAEPSPTDTENLPAEKPGGAEPAPESEGHAMRWIGVGVGVAGAASLIAGGVMRPQEQTVRVQEEGGWTSESRARFEPRNTAILLGVGGIAVGAGVALVVADAVLSKQRKRKRSAVIAPSVSSTSFIFTLRSRF